MSRPLTEPSSPRQQSEMASSPTSVEAPSSPSRRQNGRPSIYISCEDAEETIFDRLPPELLSLILSHLRFSSVLRFSITSRRILCLVNERTDIRARLRSPETAFERARFLLDYDELHPNEFSCFACGVFHPRTVTRLINDNGKQSYQTEVVSFECPKGPGYNFPLQKVQVNPGQPFTDNGFRWSMLHETMRGYRFSPCHGNPHLMDIEIPPSSVRQTWGFDSTALPENDRLLLRMRSYIGFDNPDHRLVLGNSYDYICPHFTLTVSRGSFLLALLETMAQSRLLDDPKYSGKIDFCSHRCKECPTEVHVSLHRTPDFWFPRNIPAHAPKTKYILSISQFIGFGACKSPREIEWLSVTSKYRLPNDPRLSQFGFSYLRDRPIVPRERWPVLDLTYKEQIHRRFEALVKMKWIKGAVSVEERRWRPAFGVLDKL